MAPSKVLMVLSSADSFDEGGKYHPVGFDEGGKPHPTGWYLPEFAHPYNQISPHAEVIIASPKGGEAPLDPSSVEAFKDDKESTEFLNNQIQLWKNTEKLADFKGKANEFSAIFFVGGHGPMIDLRVDEDSKQIIKEFWEAGKVVSAVCHGPIALAHVKLSDGSYLVADSPITGFSNAEEDQAKLSEYMPEMLETVLKQNGAKYEKAAEPWGEKVVVGKEGRLLTGQNPASAGGLGKSVVQAISKA